MARTPRDVTDAELAVLQALWDRGPASRRQLADVVYPAGAPAHYTTVQKLLERLQAKGYVASQRGPGGLTFAATVGREELISRRLRDVADKLCEGSLTPVLTTLIRAQKLTTRELQELRDHLSALMDETTPPGKRR